MKHTRTYEILDIHKEDIVTPIIRKKEDTLKVLLKCCKVLITQDKVVKTEPHKNYLTLKVSKMSRIFISDTNRTYSLNFPFSTYEDSDNRLILRLSEVSDLIINNLILDALLFILESFDFSKHSLYDLLDLISKYQYVEELDEDISSYDPSSEKAMGIDELLEKIIFHLFCHEDGYFRYDYDLANFKKDTPHLHPKYHIDLFYSSNPTFKLGFKQRQPTEVIVDIVDITTDCMYLQAP